MNRKWIALGLCAALASGVLSGCNKTEAPVDSDTTAPVSAPDADTNSNEAVFRTPAAVDLTDAVTISLEGTTAEIDGKGAGVSGGAVTISAAGTYVLSGTLTEGRVLVDAKGEEVVLVLNGADITCSYGSPIYIYKSSTTTIHVMEGTENTLTDGAAYTFADEYSSEADEEPNACLYSKSDLVIQGAGTLTVNANYNNGITSKDTLAIRDLTLTVSAVNHGINGKDSNQIDSAVITVTCGGDAIRSTNDTDTALGWVSISNSVLDLTAGEDGVQAETALTMSSGNYNITSGGGSTVQPSDETSAKGLKAGTALTLAGGIYILDCSDDAVHSNGDVTVSGGVYTVSTGDDGFHADEVLTVSGGEITVLTSYEGLEGTTVDISGGTVYVTASDDGVNAGGGKDGSGFGGFGPGSNFGGDSDCIITISGGYLYVSAGGDGLDSNGSAVMSGGTVIMSSTGTGDGALDYESSFDLTGGTLLAFDAGGMSAAPSSASQYTVFVGFGSTLSEGAYVSLAGEGQSFVFKLPVNASAMVFSSPELEGGAAYTVSYGGAYSGESADGVCSGGSYSGGTELAELTLSDYITSYGNAGIGGGRPGGMKEAGGFAGPDGMDDTGGPGGQMPEGTGKGDIPGGRDSGGELPDWETPKGGLFGGETPDGDMPQRPDGGMGDAPGDGAAPEFPADGELPGNGGGMPDGGGDRGEAG